MDKRSASTIEPDLADALELIHPTILIDPWIGLCKRKPKSLDSTGWPEDTPRRSPLAGDGSFPSVRSPASQLLQDGRGYLRAGLVNWGWGLGIALLLSLPLVRAEVITDGTLGPAGSLPGPNFLIPETLGRTAGTNLFHSFHSFNIAPGQSATFTGPAAIDNVFARVTGGSRSIINGALNSTIESANLWFINPSGVLFGPSASVNVDGSFHVTTADYVRFADGLRFSADTSEQPVLTSAAPEAFGFLNEAPQAITFEGSGSELAETIGRDFPNYGGRIAVPDGKTLSVVGGDITIRGGSFLDLDSFPVESRLQAPAGRINIASVASSGEVKLTHADVEIDSHSRLGKIDLDNGSSIDVIGQGTKGVFIRGGSLTLSNSANIRSINGQDEGGRISAKTKDSISISNSGRISSVSFGTGDSGSIEFETGRLELTDRARVESNNFFRDPTTGNVSVAGQGRAGQIKIKAGQVTLSGLSALEASTATEGDALGISIETGQLEISNSGINTSTGTSFNSTLRLAGPTISSTGRGGNIRITASESVLLLDGGVAGSTTIGPGHAGDIIISTPILKMDSTNINTPSGLTTSSIGDGYAGNIDLTVNQTLDMANNSRIFSSTAPNLFQPQLQPNKGNAGNVTIRTARLSLRDGATIDSSSFLSDGRAGDISVLANSSVEFSGDGFNLRSGLSSATSGRGFGGSVKVVTPSLVIKDNGQIFASTVSDANASNIDIEVTDLMLANRGRILSESTGTRVIDQETGLLRTAQGRASNISVKAKSTVEMSDSHISTTTATDGDGGGIRLDVRNLNLASNAGIFSTSGKVDEGSGEILVGKGNAGQIEIAAAKEITVSNNSAITTNTVGEGNAGLIELVVADGEISISEGSLVASSSSYSGSSEGKGSAGGVRLTADKLTISRSTLEANTLNGKGGALKLFIGGMELAAGAQVSTTTFGVGNAGGIELHANDIKISGANQDNVFFLPDGRPVQGSYSGLYLNTSGSGEGGSLTLNAGRLNISDGGVISAISALAPGVAGKGGDIEINANSVELTEGGLISAATSGAGSAGNVSVVVNGPLIISGQLDSSRYPRITNPRISKKSGIDNSATRNIDPDTPELGDGGAIKVSAASITLTNGGEISVSTEDRGTGGDISLSGKNISLESGGAISSSSTGSGNAGNISINAGDRFQSKNGRVSTEAEEADGGNITLNARERVHLRDSGITASVKSGKGQGGNIFIDPTFVILDNSRIIANAFGGPGGNIRIVADHFIKTPDSIVSASSQFGVQGTVVIDSPDTNIIGKVMALPANFLDASSLFKQHCAARYAGGQSSLVVRGHETIQPPPGEFLYIAPYPEDTTEPRDTPGSHSDLRSNDRPNKRVVAEDLSSPCRDL